MSESEKSQAVRVLVADAISDKGIALLRETPGFEVDVRIGLSPEELLACIGEYDALLVRSATKARADVLAAAKRLRVIGRAGSGVDNIDIDAATAAGIIVINTPGGNSVAAAEQTMALILSLARNLPQANADLRAGLWERKRWVGTELQGKTLGIVGLGRIGREVARRARAFRMKVLGYDPFVTQEAVIDLGIECQPLDDVLAGADIVTLHLPLGEGTHHLIDAAAIARMKPRARIVNCARGGLLDETAVLDALESGHLAGAALDVFEKEPPEDRRLVEHPRVVCTPHLGASTAEAQERVATEIAGKVRDFFQSGVILDAVNFPSVGREEFAVLQPLMDLADRLGRFLAQVTEGGFQRLEVRGYGEFLDRPWKPVVMAAARGLLAPVVEGGVSYVNALRLAQGRGITVDDARSSEPTPYAGLLRLQLTTDHGTTGVAGTLFSNRPRLIEVDGVPIESTPDGHLLFFRNRDVPGVVGKVGTILGNAGVNIAGIQLGRSEAGADAVSIIDVDNAVPADALDEIRAFPEVFLVRAVVV